MRLRVTSKADPWFIVGMSTFELSSHLLGAPINAFMLVSQNLIGCSLLRQE